jgi:hypothetical protein
MTENMALILLNCVLIAALLVLLIMHLRLRWQKEDEQETAGTLWCLDQDPTCITLGDIVRHTHKISIKRKRKI